MDNLEIDHQVETAIALLNTMPPCKKESELMTIDEAREIAREKVRALDGVSEIIQIQKNIAYFNFGVAVPLSEESDENAA